MRWRKERAEKVVIRAIIMIKAIQPLYNACERSEFDTLEKI
jgi:hypothetical protein